MHFDIYEYMGALRHIIIRNAWSVPNRGCFRLGPLALQLLMHVKLRIMFDTEIKMGTGILRIYS